MAGHLCTMAHSQKQSVLMIFEYYTCKILCSRFLVDGDNWGWWEWYKKLVVSIPNSWEDHQFDNIPLGRGRCLCDDMESTSSMDEVTCTETTVFREILAQKSFASVKWRLWQPAQVGVRPGCLLNTQSNMILQLRRMGLTQQLPYIVA